MCSALLFHRLMGRKVLSTSFSGTNMIRAYSHCSRKSVSNQHLNFQTKLRITGSKYVFASTNWVCMWQKGITLLLINLDGNNTVQVEVSVSNVMQTQALNRNTAPLFAKSGGVPRKEYHLTAPNGDLHSQTVLLNGKPLTVDSSGDIPPLQPISVNPTQPIIVSPYSIVFVQFPGIQVPVCSR